MELPVPGKYFLACRLKVIGKIVACPGREVNAHAEKFRLK
jgi:hypothetical protein